MDDTSLTVMAIIALLISIVAIGYVFINQPTDVSDVESDISKVAFENSNNRLILNELTKEITECSNDISNLGDLDCSCEIDENDLEDLEDNLNDDINDLEDDVDDLQNDCCVDGVDGVDGEDCDTAWIDDVQTCFEKPHPQMINCLYNLGHPSI